MVVSFGLPVGEDATLAGRKRGNMISADQPAGGGSPETINYWKFENAHQSVSFPFPFG